MPFHAALPYLGPGRQPRVEGKKGGAAMSRHPSMPVIICGTAVARTPDAAVNYVQANPTRVALLSADEKVELLKLLSETPFAIRDQCLPAMRAALLLLRDARNNPAELSLITK